MYVIAFLLEAKKNVVIPFTWVHGIENQWQKFLNKAINRNQTFLCFYSEQQFALDHQGQPNIELVPNWHQFLTIRAVFPSDGVYYANLVAFKGIININSLY